MRLIDADELKKKVYMEEDPYGETKMVVLETDVDEAPTIDAIRIVRCKDCEWYIVNELTQKYEPDRRRKPRFCDLYERYTEADYFCADGERRDEYETHD